MARAGDNTFSSEDHELADGIRFVMDGAPMAFAITRGPDHLVVFANRAFRELAGISEGAALGRPITAMLDFPALAPLLERALAHARAFRDEPVGRPTDDQPSWTCAAWPLSATGSPPGLAVQFRPPVPADAASVLQREIAGRMLLGALHEKETAEIAEASHERAAFLAEAGRRLSESVDLESTRATVAGLHLPPPAAWCIVDVIDENDAMHRLAVVHPEPAKQALARRLESAWSPEPDDPFGAPAMLHSPQPLVIAENVQETLTRAAHDPAHLNVLLELGIGPLLTVPMLSRSQVMGAITFVGTRGGPGFTPDDVQLAADLAARSALALENARLFGDAVHLRMLAQTANDAKSQFLAHMSHELRTPLNAIAGYVDIIDLEIHGPVTELQRRDLERIKRGQQHLLLMITDILNFTQIERGALTYNIGDVSAREILTEALDLMEPLLARKEITTDVIDCDAGIMLRADRDRTLQILVNLLNNAIKFTPAGGEIGFACSVAENTVLLTVSDNGIGIPADRQEAVFEPFAQVNGGLTDTIGGVGLGLAISRDLARAMDGDVTLESTPGVGSRFTLALPRGQSSGKS